MKGSLGASRDLSSPLRTTYPFLPSMGGFCRCLPCLRLMMDLWFLTKEWSSSLEGCPIFACCVEKVASCGTTYTNKDLDLLMWCFLFSLWVLRRNSITKKSFRWTFTLNFISLNSSRCLRGYASSPPLTFVFVFYVQKEQYKKRYWIFFRCWTLFSLSTYASPLPLT